MKISKDVKIVSACGVGIAGFILGSVKLGFMAEDYSTANLIRETILQGNKGFKDGDKIYAVKCTGSDEANAFELTFDPKTLTVAAVKRPEMSQAVHVTDCASKLKSGPG